MSLSLYEASIPPFLRGLQNLSAILDKGRAFADANGIAHADLLGRRLFEDMAPLTAQVQRVSDTAKGVAVRVGGVANVAMPDDEASFDDLQARIAKTIAFLEAVPASTFDGRDDVEVILTTPNGSHAFTGRSFITTFALPNFYFHVTTAYALLRGVGVPIGKLDYLGSR